MSEYVPDTETVREQYTREQPPHIGTVSEKSAEFDRWLRQVKAEALREAARDASGRWNVKPYVDQWLAARADRIEGQETP